MSESVSACQCSLLHGITVPEAQGLRGAAALQTHFTGLLGVGLMKDFKEWIGQTSDAIPVEASSVPFTFLGRSLISGSE